MGIKTAWQFYCVNGACGTMVMPYACDAKEAGLKSLLQVQQLTGQSAQTLTNWHRDKPELFKIVILGCVKASKEM